MNKEHNLNQILSILHTVKEDNPKLEKILKFLLEEIYEENEDEPGIPEKYQKLVHEVADHINAGMNCFINPETLEIEAVPAGLADSGEFEAISGERWEDTFKHESWSRCITIEPPESRVSFKIMEQFTQEVNDNKLQSQLIFALNHKRPFANFKYIVETSTWREQWFAFKMSKLEGHVWDEIQLELQQEK